jgi:outer membrane receptor protein involved in Fe transport
VTLLLGFCGWSSSADEQADAPRRHRTVYVYATSGGDTQELSRGTIKTDTPTAQIAQAITVITGDLMRDQAMTGVGDPLRFVPGVTAAQGEGRRDAAAASAGQTAQITGTTSSAPAGHGLPLVPEQGAGVWNKSIPSISALACSGRMTGLRRFRMLSSCHPSGGAGYHGF